MSRPWGRFTRSKVRQGDILRHQIPAPCPHFPPHRIYIDRCITHMQKNYTMILFPCIMCGNEVRPRQQALQCDECGFWQHCICGTGVDQATYRLAVIRGRIDWLCIACSLAASNPSDQVPAAESTRTDFAQGKEMFVPDIILF